MAGKKPPARDYSALALVPVTPPPAEAAAPPPTPAVGAARRGVRTDAVQVTLYVSDDFRAAMNVYAAEHRIKPHDCYIEALEAWAKAHHIAPPVRVGAKL